MNLLKKIFVGLCLISGVTLFSQQNPIEDISNAKIVNLTTSDLILDLGASVYVYQAETDTLTGRFTIQPTDEVKQLIDTVFLALKDSGDYESIDLLYIFAIYDRQAAAQNWIENDHNVTEVDFPLWLMNIGYRGTTGTSGAYLEANFNMSSDASNYQLNSNSFSVFIEDEATANSQYWYGVADNPVTALVGVIDRNSPTTDLPYNNNITSIIYDFGASDFYFTTNRTNSTTVRLLKNGVLASESTSNNSVTVPAHEFYIFARNNADISSQRGNDATIKALCLGDAATDAEHRARKNIFEYFFTRLDQIYP